MIPVYDQSEESGRQGLRARIDRLKGTVSLTGEQAAAVADILAAVRQDGDDAVVRYMQQWTDPAFDASRICVGEDELAAAAEQMDAGLKQSIQRAIDNVRAYQQHVLPQNQPDVQIGGARLGLRFSPVDSAGLYVPGGTAVLFSTLVMTAVPALVAGVPADRLAVVCPPPTRQAGQSAGDISPIVLGTAHMLGLKQVYRIGGAQAVAALAYGTQSVQPVDLIAGPGNVFVQLAKAMVSGTVGTEGGFYGPSEIVVVADDTARADRMAADLLAQAEHNPGKCFFVSWRQEVIDAVLAEMARQLPLLPRQEAVKQALLDESCMVRVADEAEAAEVANRLAGEHVTLAVADPDAWAARIRHGGELFLGDATPVAAGDYIAGPSHCLPTGTTGRFASGLSVYTFLKRTGLVSYHGQGMPADVIADVAAMARAEGLEAHARSAELRS